MFRQHAKGIFTTEVGGQWHCGPDHTSPKQLLYEVTIQYPDSALDSHGFLVDNLAFQQYFDTIRYTEDSCEMLAKKAADWFCGLCQHKEARVDVDICVPGLADIDYTEVESTNNRLRGVVG